MPKGQALLDPALAQVLAQDATAAANFGVDTSVHGQSGTPFAVGELPSGPILSPEVVAEFGGETGIRLNHLQNASHHIRHPVEDYWYRIEDHVIIVDTIEEAEWLRDIVGRDVLVYDDLPKPIECLPCKSRGEVFATKCLQLYAVHMMLRHSG